MYGKCIAAEYQNVGKDMCKQEFMKLKDCYLVCRTNTTLVYISGLSNTCITGCGEEAMIIRTQQLYKSINFLNYHNADQRAIVVISSKTLLSRRGVAISCASQFLWPRHSQSPL